MSVELVILVDNAAGGEGLQAEHGLSILVSGPGMRVLLDAGATGGALLHNAAALGVDLAGLDAIVVSHGHNDHTGGLADVVERRAGVTVYAHGSAFSRRWADHPGQPLADVSCPHSIERLCQAGAVFHAVGHPHPLSDWLVISGPIGGPKCGREVFVVRKAGDMVVDGFEDEMCLLARGQAGWAVLTGCCHRGLRNTLRTAQFLVHGEPLAAVVGGLHLGKADSQEIAEAAEAICRHGVGDIYPCHCTGPDAVARLQEALPGRVHPLTVGSRVIF